MTNTTNGIPNVLSLDGVAIVLKAPYNSGEHTGVAIVAAAAGLSIFCALMMLGILGLLLWKQRSNPSEHFFVRTHAAAFFSSLVVADLIQGIGSIMNIKWVVEGGISLGTFCSTQGALKNAGNLAVSLWTLMLAIHTFCILFLRQKPRDRILYVSLIGIWLFVGFLIILGPAGIQKEKKGPYYSISGHWCWISDPYPVARIMLEYFWMFSCALVSLVLSVLTYFHLRGNIEIEGGRVKFVRTETAWKHNISRNSVDVQMTAVVKGMIGFPVLFVILVLPIAICRFIAWSGKRVSFDGLIFADSVFSLMGVFHLILFVTTRAVFPREHVALFAPRSTVPSEVGEYGVEPYVVSDFASAHGFKEMEQPDMEKGMMTLPPRTRASLSRLEMNRPPPLRGLEGSELPPIPPIPEDADLPHPRFVDNRMTVASVYSQEDSAGTPKGADWDVVDLNRSERSGWSEGSEGGASTFSPESAPRRGAAAARSTVTSTLYGSDLETSPSGEGGTGIDLAAGWNRREENDDRYLIGRRL